MTDDRSHRRYLLALGAGMAGILLPILLLNLQLLNRALGVHELTLQASAWQQSTQGVVNLAGDVDGYRTFKTLRLHDRLSEVDTLVLGSSTLMGLTERALPAPVRAYNFATNSNQLNIIIGEADFIQAHYRHVKRLILPIDWATGGVYLAVQPPVMNLTLAAALESTDTASTVTPAERLREAVSYPRIANLFTVLGSVARAADPAANFLGTFFEVGREYRCADGALARDFDVVYRADCRGFRFDGSGTFASLARVTDPEKEMRTALSPNGRYVAQLRVTNGQPDAQLLARLVSIDRRARENGGELILVRPPLFPGFEAALTRLPGAAAALARTDADLRTWASGNRLAMVDAGRSENFGCVASEFVDVHHAVNTCFEKVFAAGWPVR